MFISVYAIAKNEEKFCEAFMTSASEADEVVVLDTGSEDETVEKLRELGAKVTVKIIEPWRFDVARNESLKLVSREADVCVCFDLDELLTPGWRAAVETAWKAGKTEQAHYRYVWNYNADGSEGTTFTREKIHAPGLFEWTHPVHEVLTRVKTDKSAVGADGNPPATPGMTNETGGSPSAPTDTRPEIYISGFTCEHHADDTKSRADYLPLLELSVKEDPQDDRNMHYLGREYMFRGMWTKAIKTLERHLGLKSAQWAPERCASMRFIGRCYDALGERERAAEWFERACLECPQLREPWYEAARHWYEAATSGHRRAVQEGNSASQQLRNEWAWCVNYGEMALSITARQDNSYIQDGGAWASDLYQIMTVAYDKTGRTVEALKMAAMALLAGNKGDKSLWSNLSYAAGQV
jgi:tetratricopeptide (TPR) repeat protein